jgi:hypothetical protein
VNLEWFSWDFDIPRGRSRAIMAGAEFKASDAIPQLQFHNVDSVKPPVQAVGVSIIAGLLLTGQTPRPSSEYHIYAGSTHAHTSYTWSHGEQFAKNDCAGIQVYARNPSTNVFT